MVVMDKQQAPLALVAVAVPMAALPPQVLMARLQQVARVDKEQVVPGKERGQHPAQQQQLAQ
jgi:hypothetical protein